MGLAFIGTVMMTALLHFKLNTDLAFANEFR